jgi:hypothetical protein
MAAELGREYKKLRITDDEDPSNEGDGKKRIRHTFRTPQRNRALALVKVWGVENTWQETGIAKTNLKRWKKNGPHRKKGSGRKILYPLLEQRLLLFIKHNREQNKAVSVRELIAKGRMIP